MSESTENASPPEHPAGRVLLASASPRRRRLLAWLGLPYDTTSVDVPEDLSGPLASQPAKLAEKIAVDKARAAVPMQRGRLIMACDTIVVLEGRVLGKPESLAEARRMLADLSGRNHQVITACALLAPASDVPVTMAVTTTVSMCDLAEEDIEAWVGKGELLGCAGAYNIEHHLATVGDRECYQNVAGLPLCHLYVLLKSLAGGAWPEVRTPVAECERARGKVCELGRELTG